MLLGENKEISSTTHQTLQKKEKQPQDLNSPIEHAKLSQREDIRKKSTTTLRK